MQVTDATNYDGLILPDWKLRLYNSTDPMTKFTNKIAVAV
jgi:hypothetical protein